MAGSTRAGKSNQDGQITAIVEAARALGCQEVLSEDLNVGQNYGGVRVVNPFAAKRGRPGKR
jgi:predicted nucleic acid-binding protein